MSANYFTQQKPKFSQDAFWRHLERQPLVKQRGTPKTVYTQLVSCITLVLWSVDCSNTLKCWWLKSSTTWNVEDLKTKRQIYSALDKPCVLPFKWRCVFGSFQLLKHTAAGSEIRRSPPGMYKTLNIMGYLLYQLAQDSERFLNHQHLLTIDPNFLRHPSGVKDVCHRIHGTGIFTYVNCWFAWFFM